MVLVGIPVRFLGVVLGSCVPLQSPEAMVPLGAELGAEWQAPHQEQPLP